MGDHYIAAAGKQNVLILAAISLVGEYGEKKSQVGVLPQASTIFFYLMESNCSGIL